MTKSEILSIVNAIYFGPTDTRIVTSLLERLRDDLPHSGISDLIFWNPVELTPEEIVDEAMRREAEYARKAGQG